MKIVVGVWLLLIGLVCTTQAMERFEIVTTQELKQMLTDRTVGAQDFSLGISDICLRLKFSSA